MIIESPYKQNDGSIKLSLARKWLLLIKAHKDS